MTAKVSKEEAARLATRRPAFWVTLVRGIFAIVLGLLLIFHPDKARPTLVTFMGIFWLMNGIVSIRFGITGERPKALSLSAGIIGIVAGLGAISRRFVAPHEASVLIVVSLGAIILLSGVLHVTEGFRRGTDHLRHRKHLASVLGVFEIVLGVLLILEPQERNNLIYWMASLWALLVGAILVGDALRMRVQERRETANS
jgi:uncharacterized membrane protein HdeD (DUF308 family)